MTWLEWGITICVLGVIAAVCSTIAQRPFPKKGEPIKRRGFYRDA